MADVPLNIVAFRYNPGGLSDQELDNLNQEMGKRILVDGQFLVGTSKLGPRSIFRPAFSNWRTRIEDVNEFIDVVLKTGSDLHKSATNGKN